MANLKDQIEDNSVPPIYRNLSEDVLKGFLSDITLSTPTPSRGFTMFTGIGGMITFDLTMKYGSSFGYRHVHTSKYCGTIFSIGKKNGMVKIQDYKRQLILRKGGEVLGKYTSIDELRHHCLKLDYDI